MKLAKYIVKSLVLGVLCVLFVNIVGQFFDLKVPFSIVSIVLVGFFRLPGFIILLIFLIL